MNYLNLERILLWEEGNVLVVYFLAHLDDPLFIGIEKVIARIVSNQCNTINNTTTTTL